MEENKEKEKIYYIPIEDIIPNRFQPRLAFDEKELNELANSIIKYGVIQPIVLRNIGDKYEIIAGERRYRAAMLAGLSSVPAVIAKIDDKSAQEVAISENVQRKELNPIEEAKSYQALLNEGFMTKDVFAKKLGIPVSVLEAKLKLLYMPQEVQDALLAGKISERHAKTLMKIKESSDQVKWLHEIIDKRLNVKELENEIAKEYGDLNASFNIDIDKLKSTSTDINVPLIQPINPVSNTNVGPINLGEKRQNKFFNDLEDEQANMSTDETANPFQNSYMSFESDKESIDSLDFLPPN